MNNLFDIEDGMIMEYFGDCEELVIPDGVRDIFFQVFMYNIKITKVTIPGSISDLTASTFAGCPALREAILREGVKLIEFGAFEECEKLESVTLPKSLREIQKNAFKGCTVLREIRYCGSREDWNGVIKGEDWDKDTGEYKIIFDLNV